MPDPVKIRDRLETDLAKIDEAMTQAESSAGTVTLDQSSVGRLSRMDAMQQQAMAQGMQQRLSVQRRKLKAALDRIGLGTFGFCCECGAEIEAERLENDPATVFCADCMAVREADHGKH